MFMFSSKNKNNIAYFNSLSATFQVSVHVDSLSEEKMYTASEISTTDEEFLPPQEKKPHF